jgi:hypothetical protein
VSSYKPRLEVGKTYKNRLGEEHYILRQSTTHSIYPMIALDSRKRLVAFHFDGRYERGNSERDLIIEHD